MTFGELGIGREGVHCRGRLLDWAEVEGVELQGAFRIRRRGAGRFDWWHRRFFLVPNERVFLGMVGHYLGRHKTGS